MAVLVLGRVGHKGYLLLGEKKGKAKLFVAMIAVDCEYGPSIAEYEVDVKPELLREAAEALEKAKQEGDRHGRGSA